LHAIVTCVEVWGCGAIPHRILIPLSCHGLPKPPFRSRPNSVVLDHSHECRRIGVVRPYSRACLRAAALVHGASARAAARIPARISRCGRADIPCTAASMAPTPKISTGT